MPQGSYLGPLTFVILIDSLRMGWLTHKFVDDTTMTEILDKSVVSRMQIFIDAHVQQATDAGMNVNGHKTKEMLFSSILKDPPLPVSLSGTPVERVTTFKLMGVHVANDMKWLQHVDAILSTVSSKLYFLHQLKRSGTGPEDMLYFYVVAIRPVLQYACPVRHSGLTAAQTKALESLQHRALKIIFRDNDYLTALIFASVDMLETR